MDATGGHGWDESLRGRPEIPAGAGRAGREPPSPGIAAGWPPGGPAPGEIVIAPAHPDAQSTEIVFEVRQATDGTPVLPVFSSVRRLVEALGPAQPWVALPLHRARELAARGGVREVMLDPHLAPGAWRWQPQDLGELAQALGHFPDHDTSAEVRPR